MKKSNSTLHYLFQTLVFLARSAIGITVIWVGYTLVTEKLYLAQSMNNSFVTGIFLLVIGSYFCFTAFRRGFFDP